MKLIFSANKYTVTATKEITTSEDIESLYKTLIKLPMPLGDAFLQVVRPSGRVDSVIVDQEQLQSMSEQEVAELARANYEFFS